VDGEHQPTDLAVGGSLWAASVIKDHGLLRL
jgi:hypothetical protein